VVVAAVLVVVVVGGGGVANVAQLATNSIQRAAAR
jgi:hypothetical protein